MALGDELLLTGDPDEEPEAEEEEEDEEDLIDPHDLIKDECKVTPACQRIDLKLADCTNRVQGAGDETEETCHEEISALAHCIDHCVAPTLFSKLK